MPTDPRRTTGQLGEDIAAHHLQRSGYRILERNFRTRFGELDLVVIDSNCLVFCEVKTRLVDTGRGPAGPLDAVGPQKRRRLRRMAAQWLGSRDSDRPRAPRLRYDVIGVTVDGHGSVVALEHVQEAF
jgi:putative endonuclease